MLPAKVRGGPKRGPQRRAHVELLWVAHALIPIAWLPKLALIVIVHGLPSRHVHGHGRQVGREVHVMHARLARLTRIRHVPLRHAKALLCLHLHGVSHVAAHLPLMHMPWLRQRGHVHGLGLVKPLPGGLFLREQKARVLGALLRELGALRGVRQRGEHGLLLRGPTEVHLHGHGRHVRGHHELARLRALPHIPGLARRRMGAHVGVMRDADHAPVALRLQLVLLRRLALLRLLPLQAYMHTLASHACA